METFGVLYGAALVIIAGFAIGSFFALPMIWYHAGHVSRKLDRIIKLLESAQGN